MFHFQCGATSWSLSVSTRKGEGRGGGCSHLVRTVAVKKAVKVDKKSLEVRNFLVSAGWRAVGSSGDGLDNAGGEDRLSREWDTIKWATMKSLATGFETAGASSSRSGKVAIPIYLLVYFPGS